MPRVCILAGGLGTRLSEETVVKPKPMVEIGGKPMLWHIMKIFASHGMNDFVVALGYKGEYIKDYFVNYARRAADLSVDLSTGSVSSLNSRAEDWKIQLVDTGLTTHTGGRVKQLCEVVGDGIFFMTYGDGVADVNIRELLEFHRAHGKLATVTAVVPPARFGALAFDGDRVESFQEKPAGGDGWINGGFFVLDARVGKYIDSPDMPFEQEPLRKLARDGQLMGYKHSGFWHSMDTLRDVNALSEMWANGAAPWKVWSEIDREQHYDEPQVLARP